MTWTKLSDDFGDETWTLSDSAFRLLVEGLNFSNRKLLDGVLPKDELRRFAKHPEAAAELVADGWWTDEGDSYRIVFHAQYQPLKAAVLQRQETNRRNGLKGGRPSRPGRERAPETRSLTQALSARETQRDGTGQDGKQEPPSDKTDLEEPSLDAELRLPAPRYETHRIGNKVQRRLAAS